MKQITYRVNSKTGYMTLADGKNVPRIQEYENNAVRLVFEFNRPIKVDDNLFIHIANSKFKKPYRLERVSSNKFCFDLPREMLVRGRLVFVIQHYDKEMTNLIKYSPESYLYVTAGGDITNDMLESRPDLFAELYWRIEKLEEEITKLKARD